MDTDELLPLLNALLRDRLSASGDVANLIRLTGGATKTTWSFDVPIGPETGATGLDTRTQAFILQQTFPTIEPSGPISRMARVTGGDDASLMMTAAQAGVPVPRIRLVLDAADGMGAGFVSDRIEGETIARRINRDSRFAAARDVMAAQCGTILASIHRLSFSHLTFLKGQGAADQVAVYRDIWESLGFVQPAMELALKWAEANAPPSAGTTLVHGDFRNGNLIVGPEGIRAVLDWELAHVGDPIEDLGWLCVKTWRFGGKLPVGGFGGREDMVNAYEESSGKSVDTERLRFWEAFGSVKWAVMCAMRARSFLSGEHCVEAAAIGRRMEEPLYDFLNLIYK